MRPTARLLALLPLAWALAGAGFFGGSGWQEGPPVPEPRWLHAAASGPEGRIAVFGGYVLAPGGFREYGREEYSLRVYDPKTKRWEKGPPAPAYRMRYQVRVIGTNELKEKASERRIPHEIPTGTADSRGRVFWFGYHAGIFYDLSTGKWSQPPSPLYIQREDRYEGSVPSTMRRAAATVRAADGRIFRIAGLGRPRTAYKAEHELATSVDFYDPETNTWGEASPLRHARQVHAAALGSDGRIYVFGGCACKSSARIDEDDPEVMRQALLNSLEARRSVEEVEIYDPETDTWTLGAPMPRPRQMLGAATGADGRIYVVGGVPGLSRGNSSDAVDVYDPRTDTWSEGPDLRQARHSHAVVAAPDGRIFAIGGFERREGALAGLLGGGAGPLAAVEVLETAAEEKAPEPEPAPPDRG